MIELNSTFSSSYILCSETKKQRLVWSPINGLLGEICNLLISFLFLPSPWCFLWTTLSWLTVTYIPPTYSLTVRHAAFMLQEMITPESPPWRDQAGIHFFSFFAPVRRTKRRQRMWTQVLFGNGTYSDFIFLPILIKSSSRFIATKKGRV